ILRKVSYYYYALKIAEEIGDKYVAAVSYSTIGQIFQAQGNPVESQKNYFASLKIYQESDDKYDMAFSYTNIGNCYQDQNKHAEALHYYNLGLKLHKEFGNMEGIATSYNNIGILYSTEGNYTEALKNYFAALSIREKSGNTERISNSYNSIGICKLKMHNVKEGKEWLMKALLLADEVGAVENMRESYENLTVADSALGDFKSAYEHHKYFIFFRDSLNNVEVTRKTVQTKMQYDFDKKESSTKAEQDKKDAVQTITRNALITGLLFLFLLALILYNRFRIKKKANIELEEKNQIILLEKTNVEREKANVEHEKQRSDSLLLNILPAEVAEELKNKGTADAKHFDNVTVLFTDFKAFTTVSEQLSPQELVDELHACFKAFDEICGKYNIEKIKTIGDAYLAVCGLPLANENHAENVVNAAQEIREFMEKRRQNLGEKTFEIRIGINSGSVVAGIVGVKKFAYDIWGDTVNTAARMEQNSEAGKINISETTYALVNKKFTCEYRGEIDAKNKGKLKMYFVEK
ncbi:MAG: tetratricopeptide repeat protein, partial [Bacteroidetes bacterium]|nr:tetratricopeptide repeat protein [Bacteroidota bacterium]